jgi:hypothetical protein
MATLPPLGTPNEQLKDALKQLSSAKFGKPRQIAEKEIFARLKTNDPPRTGLSPQSRPAAAGFGQRRPAASPYGSTAASPQTPRPAVNPNASFLDQWKAKRQKAQTNNLTSGSPGASPAANATNAAGQSQKPLVKLQETAQPDKKTPAIPAKQAKPPSHSGELKIQRDSKQVAEDSAQEDTIFIDKDGNLVAKKDDKTENNS